MRKKNLATMWLIAIANQRNNCNFIQCSIIFTIRLFLYHQIRILISLSLNCTILIFLDKNKSSFSSYFSSSLSFDSQNFFSFLRISFSFEIFLDLSFYFFPNSPSTQGKFFLKKINLIYSLY